MSKYISIIITTPLVILLTISITKTTSDQHPLLEQKLEASIITTEAPEEHDDKLQNITKEEKTKYFQTELEKNPNNKSAVIGLIKIYLNNINDTQKAIKLIQENEKQFYTDSQFITLKAKSYLHDGKNEKSLQTVGLISTSDSLLLKSLLYILKNDFQTAESILKEIEQNKKAKQLLNTYKEFNKHKSAPIEYHKTLIAQKLIEQEEYKIAELITKQVIQSNKKYRDAWTILGFSLYSQANYTEALTAFLEAYNLDKANTKIQYFLGNTYSFLEDSENSIKFLQFALQNLPSETTKSNKIPKIAILKKIAANYEKQGNYTLAGHFYEKVIEEDPNSLQYYIKTVKIYLESTTHLIKAERIALKAQKAFPQNAMAYNLLAWTQLEQGKNSKAIKNLEKALELDESLQETYLSLGNAYEKENKEKAKENYLKAKDLAPETETGIKAAKKFLLLN